MNRPIRTMRTLALPAALATVLAAAACGSSTAAPSTASAATTSHTSSSGMSSGMSGLSSSSPKGSSTAGVFNSADVQFATDMIPHHAQAVLMADLALTSAHNSQVKALAARIKGEQDPEITTMTGWLKNWGKPVPATTAGNDMSSMDTGTGMMSQQQMGDLGKATGTSFDRMWLTLMTTHHQGAVAMATSELAQGSSAEAKTLAQSIITGQNREITQMKAFMSSSR